MSIAGIRVELDAKLGEESLELSSAHARSNCGYLRCESREEVHGKIKGRGTVAASSRCLHMGFRSTSKIATVLRRIASY